MGRLTRMLTVISVIGLCSSCATTPQPSQLVGVCKKLKETGELWDDKWQGNGFGTYAGRYFIAPTGRHKIQALGRKQLVIGELVAGTKVKVVRVLKDWNGSHGHFLRIQVEILNGPHSGKIADIPTYAPYHPQPPWIVTGTLDPDKLELKNEVLGNCE